MTTTKPKRNWGRSIGAVFAGLLTNVIPAIVLDTVFHATGTFPPLGERMSDSLFLLAISYRIVLAVAGGYITARLAPSNPIKHVLVLSSIGMAMTTIGAIAMWDAGPAWYSLGIIAIAVPAGLAGAKFAIPILRSTAS